jgi:hypothetical protein
MTSPEEYPADGPGSTDLSKLAAVESVTSLGTALKAKADKAVVDKLPTKNDLYAVQDSVATVNAALNSKVDLAMLMNYAKQTDLTAMDLKIDEINGRMVAKADDSDLDTVIRADSDLSSPEYEAFMQQIREEIRSAMAGGSDVPADMDWAPCTKVLGDGLIEARVRNGMIQLRGELSFSAITATGSFTTVQKLPPECPKPLKAQTVVCLGKEDRVAYRRAFVKFDPSGAIDVCPDAKMNHIDFSGAQAYAY